MLAFIVVFFGYDLWTLVANGYDTTVSASIEQLSKNWRIIPFTFGVFAGHLFFCNCREF